MFLFCSPLFGHCRTVAENLEDQKFVRKLKKKSNTMLGSLAPFQHDGICTVFALCLHCVCTLLALSQLALHCSPPHIIIQSDLFYPDPLPSGSKSLVTDLQHMSCIHTVCVFDYPVPSPIRIFLLKTDVCSYARSDCIHAHQSCTPVMHTSHAHQSCTPVMHTSHAHRSCTLVMHTSHAHQSCTPVMHTSHAHQSCTPVMHTSHAHQSCTPVMHTSHAHQSCTPVMHSLCTHYTAASYQPLWIGPYIALPD